MKSDISSKSEPNDILVEPNKSKIAVDEPKTETSIAKNKDKIISFLRLLLFAMLFIVVIFSLLITRILFSPNPNPWLLFGMIAVMVLPMIMVMAFLFRFLMNYIKLSKK